MKYLLITAFFLVGCVTGEKMSHLAPGMTKTQVISILGTNDGYAVVEGCEVLKYSNRLSSGWSHDRADYNVVLKDGRVVEYGAGEAHSAILLGLLQRWGDRRFAHVLRAQKLCIRKAVIDTIPIPPESRLKFPLTYASAPH